MTTSLVQRLQALALDLWQSSDNVNYAKRLDAIVEALESALSAQPAQLAVPLSDGWEQLCEAAPGMVLAPGIKGLFFDEEALQKLSALLAQRAAPHAQPIYQIRNLPNTPESYKHYWSDASEEAYHYTPESSRRIVYAAPQGKESTESFTYEETKVKEAPQAQNHLVAAPVSLPSDQHGLSGALRQIQHSMRQALIPGNDKRREIELSLALATQALAPADSASPSAPHQGEMIAATKDVDHIGDVNEMVPPQLFEKFEQLDAAPQAQGSGKDAQAVAWDKFPGYLIDHCEGDVITEEGLQMALHDMLKNSQYAAAAPQEAPMTGAQNDANQPETRMDTGNALVLEAPQQEPVFPLRKVRYFYACEVTPKQRLQAWDSALYKQGDMVLVWANQGDLCSHELVAAPISAKETE